uniref:Calcium-regulated actin-bundling protein C-terminal domain-containing protein n=1 Tax=Leptocylindrus danicus TaxID=163516 RepID=A0A7S2PQR4_9STRA|mmetsp:Transcript_815/g.1144  ORF Transcript_815/g.1144 Transcript_815/m.1144 type:complete len:385 (+) Transcript_815:423-1577(+)|eukprot:CAMPEP_0116019528 /NCGR_PEP_ID=MMETSP0321-20121206/9287_1 /TAXON_ID=163516 /ORGANISM="Leptocylindrus danicus var. danicus, Strain B650" /LENGTH=384 /DNA_ID=CAMNT_0003490109 /DNA_START=901 /DNA_END=2055 /DNA_ORIENTATION=+
MSITQEEKTLEPLCHVKSLKFKDQAIWFLNSTIYGQKADTCELVWSIHKKCVELNTAGEDGTDLDEFSAHRLLEFSKQAKTIKELREFLIGLHSGSLNCPRVSLIELLIFMFGVDWKSLLRSPYGCDEKSLNEAAAGLEILRTTLTYAIAESNRAKERTEEARQAELRAAQEEAKFIKAAEAANKARDTLTQVEEEAKAILETIKAEENIHERRRSALEKKLADLSLGIVQRNKAKAELSILFSEDRTPLRKARIDQEATLQKLHKATAKAEAAAKDAQTMATLAEKAKLLAHGAVQDAVQSNKVSDESIPIAMQALKNAHVILEKLRQERSTGFGTIFYVNREIQEAEKFMPKRKLSPRGGTKTSRNYETLKRKKLELFADHS